VCRLKMTYTSIEEAWGGVSGSSMLKTKIPEPPPNIKKRMHPAHKRQIERSAGQKTKGNEYECTYYGAPCQEALDLNNQFNQDQKAIAQGFPPYYSPPYPYQRIPMLPQYPWYQVPRNMFLNYPANVSDKFYNHPWKYYPDVAMDIYNYQQQHPNQMKRPVRRRVEHFTNGSSDLHKITIVFLVFLFAMALILCVVLVFLASSLKR